MKKIEQKFYGTIEVDKKEKDVIQIWNFQKQSAGLVQIERENIPALIEILKTQIK